MNGETQDEPERSSRGAVWEWLCWSAVIVVLYVLSTGPITMMYGKKLIHPSSPVDGVLSMFGRPVAWAYEKTPLRKPLGMYWHLWNPDDWDNKGNINHVR